MLLKMLLPRLEKIAIFALGAAFTIVGFQGLFVPQNLFDPLGLPLPTIDSLNEIKATYGGLHFLIGVFMLVAAIKKKLHEQAFLIFGLVTCGLGLGRLVAVISDGFPRASINWILGSAELIGAIFFLIAYKLRTRA